MVVRAGAAGPQYNASAMTTRRWRRASWFALALTFIGVALFVRLGIWQLDRAREAQALLDAFAAAPNAAFEEFAAVSAAPPSRRFPHLRVRGHYVAGRGYLRDEQLHAGQLGVEAFAVFAVDGEASWLLVDRGWIAWSHAPGSQPLLPALPEGAVELSGIYAPFPGSGLRLGGNPLARQAVWPKLTLAVEHDEIAADLQQALLPRVLLLDAEPASGFERAWTPALMPPARHQAYAFQWFAFALAALVIFVVQHWKNVDK
jgi:cytochrome oxidase assembly protein ShyY1